MSDNSSQTDLDEFLGLPSPGIWQRHRKRFLIGGLVLVGLIVLYYLLSSGEPGKQYVTAEVVRGNLEVQVTGTGNLQPTNRIMIGSEVSGLVDAVYVDVNDRVVKGQPLARIDPQKLQDAVRKSVAALDQARAGVAQRQASLNQARANLSRLEEVYRLSDGRVPSKSELDNARAEYARAVADVRSSQAQVTSAMAQLSSERTNLARATIVSPVTGVVLSRQIEPGQTVAASFNTPTLFEIAEDLSAMKLEVKIDEADVGEVTSGQTASFTVDAFPGQHFPAQITRVNLGSNSSTTSGASGGTVVSYNAVLAVENPGLHLRPGMTATARIVTSKQTDAMLVPNGALRYVPKKDEAAAGLAIGMRMPTSSTKQKEIGRGSRQTVYVLGSQKKVRAVDVTIGNSNGAMTMISGSGIRAGDKVITGEIATEK